VRSGEKDEGEWTIEMGGEAQWGEREGGE